MKICSKCDEPVSAHKPDCKSWDAYMRREGYKEYDLPVGAEGAASPETPCSACHHVHQKGRVTCGYFIRPDPHQGEIHCECVAEQVTQPVTSEPAGEEMRERAREFYRAEVARVNGKPNTEKVMTAFASREMERVQEDLNAAAEQNIKLTTECGKYETLLDKIAEVVALYPTITGLQKGCTVDHSLIPTAIRDAQETWKDVLKREVRDARIQGVPHRADKAEHGTCKCFDCAVTKRELESAEAAATQARKDAFRECVEIAKNYELAPTRVVSWFVVRDEIASAIEKAGGGKCP